jgi:UDP-glucose 4-epimerase
MADYRGGARTFNVGTGVSYSVVELVAAIERVVGRRLPVQVDPAKVRPVERQCLIADIALIRDEVGWAPSAVLDDALAAAFAGAAAAGTRA